MVEQVKTVWLSPAELAALLAASLAEGADYVRITWTNASIWHDIDYKLRLEDGSWSAETRLLTPPADERKI